MVDKDQKNSANENPQADKNEATKEVADATDQAQETVDKETQQGFRGTEVDLTPNENYTVAGVTSGADVPEAHADKQAASFKATNPAVTGRPTED